MFKKLVLLLFALVTTNAYSQIEKLQGNLSQKIIVYESKEFQSKPFYTSELLDPAFLKRRQDALVNAIENNGIQFKGFASLKFLTDGINVIENNTALKDIDSQKIELPKNWIYNNGIAFFKGDNNNNNNSILSIPILDKDKISRVDLSKYNELWLTYSAIEPTSLCIPQFAFDGTVNSPKEQVLENSWKGQAFGGSNSSLIFQDDIDRLRWESNNFLSKIKNYFSKKEKEKWLGISNGDNLILHKNINIPIVVSHLVSSNSNYIKIIPNQNLEITKIIGNFKSNNSIFIGKSIELTKITDSDIPNGELRFSFNKPLLASFGQQFIEPTEKLLQSQDLRLEELIIETRSLTEDINLDKESVGLLQIIGAEKNITRNGRVPIMEVKKAILANQINRLVINLGEYSDISLNEINLILTPPGNEKNCAFKIQSINFVNLIKNEIPRYAIQLQDKIYKWGGPFLVSGYIPNKVESPEILGYANFKFPKNINEMNEFKHYFPMNVKFNRGSIIYLNIQDKYLSNEPLNISFYMTSGKKLNYEIRPGQPIAFNDGSLSITGVELTIPKEKIKKITSLRENEIVIFNPKLITYKEAINQPLPVFWKMDPRVNEILFIPPDKSTSTRLKSDNKLISTSFNGGIYDPNITIKLTSSDLIFDLNFCYLIAELNYEHKKIKKSICNLKNGENYQLSKSDLESQNHLGLPLGALKSIDWILIPSKLNTQSIKTNIKLSIDASGWQFQSIKNEITQSPLIMVGKLPIKVSELELNKQLSDMKNNYEIILPIEDADVLKIINNLQNITAISNKFFEIQFINAVPFNNISSTEWMHIVNPKNLAVSEKQSLLSMLLWAVLTGGILFYGYKKRVIYKKITDIKFNLEIIKKILNWIVKFIEELLLASAFAFTAYTILFPNSLLLLKVIFGFSMLIIWGYLSETKYLSKLLVFKAQLNIVILTLLIFYSIKIFFMGLSYKTIGAIILLWIGYAYCKSSQVKQYYKKLNLNALKILLAIIILFISISIFNNETIFIEDGKKYSTIFLSIGELLALLSLKLIIEEVSHWVNLYNSRIFNLLFNSTQNKFFIISLFLITFSAISKTFNFDKLSLEFSVIGFYSFLIGVFISLCSLRKSDKE